MRELSLFIDESGDIGPCSDYYLVSFVFHDQKDSLDIDIAAYRGALRDANLPERAFHFTPIVRAHDEFAMLDIGERKSHFARFRIFTERAPFRYWVLRYKKDRFPSVYALAEQVERDLSARINEHLEFFQSFAHIKIYYDNGQQLVRHAVHQAVRTCLAKNAAIYRNAIPKDYYMSQVADYVCGIELAALRYERHLDGATDHRFFGDKRSFTRNYLKKIRKKLL